MNANELAVVAVLREYQDALNQSNMDAVMKLHAPDGVFMPQNFPSSVGADTVRKAYLRVFEAITLKVNFNVAEVFQIAADWAIVRTNSTGTSKVNGTRDGSPEANQELFVFQKIDSS
ncbi:YybH family protein [Tunturiibacter psychrotolerans]|uniref:YybH family protein n=1 Tax=Tunturiibacter psychrotolerans TaxID=3069686 RepID=UPI003D205CDE